MKVKDIIAVAKKSVGRASKCINNEDRSGWEGRPAQAALQTYKSRCVSQYFAGQIVISQ